MHTNPMCIRIVSMIPLCEKLHFSNMSTQLLCYQLHPHSICLCVYYPNIQKQDFEIMAFIGLKDIIKIPEARLSKLYGRNYSTLVAAVNNVCPFCIVFVWPCGHVISWIIYSHRAHDPRSRIYHNQITYNKLHHNICNTIYTWYKLHRLQQIIVDQSMKQNLKFYIIFLAE